MITVSDKKIKSINFLSDKENEEIVLSITLINFDATENLSTSIKKYSVLMLILKISLQFIYETFISTHPLYAC